MGKKTWDRKLIKVLIVCVYIFMLLPLVIVVVAAFNSGQYLRFPPEGFSFKWFVKFFHSETLVNSFIFSLKLAVVASLSSAIIGVGTALYVVRYSRKFTTYLRALVLSPLMLPSLLTGLALMLYFYTVGIGNKTFFGLYAGHTLITLPYVFLAVTSVLYNFDYSLEEVSRSLGAGRFTTFFKVTLPLIKGGIISGYVFAFITSFDQFPLSLMLTGPGYSTLPVQIFDYLRFEFDPTAAAVSTITIALAYISVVLIERFVGLKSLYFSRRD